MATTLRTRLAGALLVPLAALSLGACASAGGSTDTAAPTPSVVATVVTPGSDATTAPDASPSSASVTARLLGETTILAEPDIDAEAVTTLHEQTELGSRTTLLVVDQRDGWIEVALPIRPNGATGWIPVEAADLRANTMAIVVDREAHALVLFDGGAVVVESPVAIGSDENPTPAGSYFVTDLVETGSPDGAYGPYAFGLSGHSETLTEFGGGDGQLGIHGTDDPSSIGRSVSHGCVRLPNDVIAQLIDLVPLGTPVTVV